MNDHPADLSASGNSQNNRINGYWFEVGNSTRRQCDLVVDVTTDRYLLVESPEADDRPISRADNAVVGNGKWSDVSVSSRVGNVPRKLTLADGSLFETLDNQTIDRLLTRTKHAAARGIRANRLESSWSLAVLSIVVLALGAVLFFKIGVPAAAHHVAHRLPVSAQEKISDGTLAALDRYMLNPSTLSIQEQVVQKNSFNRLLETVADSEFNYKLHFRSMGEIPNAFALPSGDIVITDGLVKIAKDQSEIESVMLHEIGHVIHRHGAQQVIRASATSLMVTLAVGDLSGAGELLVGLPVFLSQNSYSRKAEREADEFAFEKMQKLGIDTSKFADILTRMTSPESANQKITEAEESLPDEPLVENSSEAGSKESQGNSDQSIARKIPYYFSTHPRTAERAARARALSSE